jgi:hypothetical protein
MRLTRGALVIVVALSAGGALAEPAPQLGPRVAGVRNEPSVRLKRMVEQFGLSEKQKEDIRPLLEREANELQAVDSDAALWPVEKTTKRLQIIESNRKRIADVLTPEQRKTYDALLEKGRAQRDAIRARQDQMRQQERRAAKPSVTPQKKLGLMPSE